MYIDADDTLWENARHFQRVLAEWAELMERLGVGAARAIHVLEECEDRNIPRTGYGAAPFCASVREASALLLDANDATARGETERFAERALLQIRDHAIELLPGVRDGLESLARHRHLVVLTKGQDAEQRAKLERSGIAALFADCLVVPEKHAAVYRDATARYGASPGACFMVGNSAHSDINPARAAGLQTVHIPHDAPWHRDVEPLVTDGPVTRIAQTFAEVPDIVLHG